MEKTKSILPHYSIKGRFGIVTGAASGIGAATALHLAEMGAGVGLVDLNQAGLEKIHAAIQERTDAPALAFAVDAADEPEVARVVHETREKFGAMDFLVNSAGILRRTAFLEMPVQEWGPDDQGESSGPFFVL